VRLHSNHFKVNAEAVKFTFNGEPIDALAGETIAAALIAAQHIEQRVTTGGESRGLFCGMGVCYECLVNIDGRCAQRACLTQVRPGMRVETHHDGQLLRDAQPLVSVPANDPAITDCDMLIVGAGPAGLSAGLEAALGGLEVTILDERPHPGGQYFKPLASSHAFTAPRDADQQFTEGLRLTERVLAAGVSVINDATVWSARRNDSNELEIGVMCDGVMTLFRPRLLILATGASERRRHDNRGGSDTGPQLSRSARGSNTDRRQRTLEFSGRLRTGTWRCGRCRRT